MSRTIGVCVGAGVLAIGLFVGSCGGSSASRTAGAGAATAETTSYVAQFSRGDYAEAKSTALAAAQHSSGVERDRANLIAGLSAAQLGHNVEASRLLTPLGAHSDPQIAGRAAAGLGIVNRNQGDKSKAASLMTDGARKLSGDPAAKAYLAAGDTYAEIGAKDQAMVAYRAAMTSAESVELRSTLQERLLGKRYTVQLGAFSNKTNADRKAGEVRSKSVSLGLGAPRIENGVVKGRSSYLVQVGNFASKQEARLASAKLGGGAVVAETEIN